MSSKHKGVLEDGYWEDINPEPSLSSYTRTLRWNLDFFRPLVLKRTESLHKPLRRTAYLDGLRGFAAFLVYWHHHQLWAHDATGENSILENAFGYEEKYNFACFTGIRTLFTGGHFAVSVFYVISGYVLSTKPLSLIQAGDHVKLGDNLGSALFRRWLRLYIPFICTTFLFLTCWHALGIWSAASKPEPNYGAEVWKWYTEFKNFSFVFRTGGEPWFSYNVHLWSIPVEFKGSVVIYTVLLALSRCTKNARLLCQAALAFYFMYIADGWFCAMFIAGMLLCDLDLLAASDDTPRFFCRFDAFKELIFYNLLVISVYLGGVPSQNSDIAILKASPGWHYLSLLKPQAVFDYKWFFLFWAATSLVASVQHIPSLKRFFEMRFNQYLGRISFALYLVHGPILWTLGDRVYTTVGWPKESHNNGLPRWYNQVPLPRIGPLGLEISFLLPHIILLPTTLWVAELVTKIFDEPSVKFAAWLYGKTLARSARL
ncbi:MAG: hypothetical protein LQ340_007384 [Diploschistes diacapsis]|nr:MAG: hypothetical protein LQ340_007384 [Diploschistes diacapsis]